MRAEDNEKNVFTATIAESRRIMQCNEYELFMLNNKKYLPKWGRALRALK